MTTRTHTEKKKPTVHDEPEAEGLELSDDEIATNRGIFKGLTVDELLDIFHKEIGRKTSSRDPQYLMWKIRRARNGEIRKGAFVSREDLDLPPRRNIPFRVETEELEALDAAIELSSSRTRAHFIRRAIARELAHMRKEASSKDDRQTISRAYEVFMASL